MADREQPKRDVFLWNDGYWCFREDFHNQPRQTYDYVLVEITPNQWEALRGGAPMSSLSDPHHPTIKPH